MAETKTELSESDRILQFTLKDEQATYLNVDQNRIELHFKNQIFTFKHNKNGHHFEQTLPAKDKRVVTVPGLRFMGRSGRSGEIVDLVLVTSSGSIEFECIKALRNGAGYTPI